MVVSVGWRPVCIGGWVEEAAERCERRVVYKSTAMPFTGGRAQWTR